MLLGWLVKSKPTAKANQVKAEGEKEQKEFVPANAEAEEDVVLSVLVADMEGLGGAGISDHVADSFSSLVNVKTQRLNQTLSMPKKATSSDGVLIVMEQGRDLLHQHKAEVLIWGKIDELGTTASLRFISLKPAPEGRPGAIGPLDQLDIPSKYPPEMEDVVIAHALAVVAPSLGKARADTKALLHDYASRIKLLIDYGPDNLTVEQNLSVLSGIANVTALDAVANKGGKGLEAAKVLYEKAISLIPDEQVGLQRANLYFHLADLLQVMSGANVNDTELVGQVVTCCEKAIEALDEASHPLDWAQAHMRLGLALYRKALRVGKANLMKEAVLALKQSLRVFKKTTSPGKWAEVMNHSGVIMTAMGEQINNDAILQQALKVFNESLEIRKRTVAPILWAQTTNNMAAAAFALAKRQKDKSLMDKAAMAFDGAAEVYREAGQVKQAHVIEKNMNKVRRRLEIM